MILDQVRERYLALWGAPSRSASFTVAELTVEVLKWGAESNPEGVNMYATIGASAGPMPGRDPDHRIEFFTGLLPAKDEVASGLAALAMYPRREGVELDHGHTIPGGGPLWRGTDMSCFLVIRPRSEIIPPLHLSNGLHVEFLQTVPIYQSERDFKSAHTTEELIRHWEELGVPFWDPNRPPPPVTT